MRHRVLAVVTALLAVTVLGTDVFLLTQRNRTTTVDLTEALDRFRADEPTTPTPAGSAPAPAPAVPASEHQVLAAAASPSTTPAGGAVIVPTAQEQARSAPEPTAPAAAAELRPAEGVYSYRTSGGEQVSTAGASHDYPERTFASIRHGQGCLWEMTADVVEEHRDQRAMCTDGQGILQYSQTREVEFFGQRDGATLTCDPPMVMTRTGEAVGAVERGTCRDSQTAARIERTYIGIETMTIGGSDVEVRHVRCVAEVSGRANGHHIDDIWFLPSGLVARWDRTADFRADAAFGAKVHYVEDAEFVLESLEPRV